MSWTCFNKSCLFIKTSSVLHLFLVWSNQLGPYIHRRRVIYFVPYLIDNEHGWLKIPGLLLCFKQGPVVLEEASFYYKAPVNKNFSKKGIFLSFFLPTYNLWLFNTSYFREDFSSTMDDNGVYDRVSLVFTSSVSKTIYPTVQVKQTKKHF